MEQRKLDFVRTVEANQGIIKSLCKAYYPGLEDQKDAFQDIILQLWKSLDTFRGDSKISTWIYKVSLNTILGKVRKDKSMVTTEALDSFEMSVANAKADDDRELLGIVIRSLTGLDKAIVILYLEGYMNKEISTMLNITATNVSTRLNRIRAELKTKFNNQHYELR